MYPDEINGIVINIKKFQDVISIWNKTGSDKDTVESVKVDTIRLLGIPANSSMKYDLFSSQGKD